MNPLEKVTSGQKKISAAALREVGRLLSQSKPAMVEGDGAPGQRFNMQLGSGAITSDHGKVFVVQITAVSRPPGRRTRYEFDEVGIDWKRVSESDDDDIVIPTPIVGGLVARLPHNPAFNYATDILVIGDFALARRSRLSPYAFELMKVGFGQPGYGSGSGGGSGSGSGAVDTCCFTFNETTYACVDDTLVPTVITYQVCILNGCLVKTRIV